MKIDLAERPDVHLHIHLIPRYSGDTEDPRGGVRWIMPKKAVYWKKPAELSALDNSCAVMY